jgi:AraC-like DNA-binding protein
MHRPLKALPNSIENTEMLSVERGIIAYYYKLMNSKSLQFRLVSLLTELVRGEGVIASCLPGVRFARSTRRIPRSPIAYAEPCIVINAQGRKTGYLGAKKLVYDANHYLVVSVPLPFEYEAEGSPEKPALAVKINVKPVVVTELLMQMEQLQPAKGPQTQIMEAAQLDDALGGATIRLLECLRSADDARILGPQIVREITYHVLRGKLGRNLRLLAAPDSHFGQISRVLNRMHTEYARHYDIAMLARESGMSVAAFHTRFKTITSSPPLQYLKNVRLHKAQMLMVNEGLNASEAALKVGYESASQFSREFKRLFGNSPATEAAELRNLFVRM